MTRKFPITPAPDDSDGNINYSVDFNLTRFRGATLVVGDTVFLSDDGVEVLASTDGSYYSVNAFSFKDANGNEVGGMYGRADSGQNVVGFRVIDEAQEDEDTLLEIVSTSTTAATASVTIGANRSGESIDTTISLERGDSTSEIDILANSSGRVRIGRTLNLLGASLELVDIYIKGSNFILKYNDGGSTRYKYLDLSGTSTTWTQATSEP